MVWLQIMLEVNDYDLNRVYNYMKLPHQLCFMHITMVGRRNRKVQAEYDRVNKKR